MKYNSAHGYSEGSEPIKLTDGSEEPKESIIKFLYGSSLYKGYWFGDIPPGKPSFWWRNLLREEIEAKDAEHKQQLKEERNKAIDECRHEIALWLTEPEKLGSELMERITALKSDSK